MGRSRQGKKGCFMRRLPYSFSPASGLRCSHVVSGFGSGNSHSVRIGARSLKGYYRHQFEDLWVRYLGRGAQETSQRHTPTATGTSATPTGLRKELSSAIEKGRDRQVFFVSSHPHTKAGPVQPGMGLGRPPPRAVGLYRRQGAGNGRSCARRGDYPRFETSQRHNDCAAMVSGIFHPSHRFRL
jgi:hypothetical protein